MRRRTFIVELDMPDDMGDTVALDEIHFNRLYIGQGADHENINVQILEKNSAVFSADNSMVLRLPIRTDPPKDVDFVMTLHSEGIQNWVSSGISFTDAMGYIVINCDTLLLPVDENK